MNLPPTTEFWNIWTSILPLAILIHISFPDPSPIHIACIICQLCSAIYHCFNSLSPMLYNLDLTGICCMSIGSPHLYLQAYGTDGLEVYVVVLSLFALICIWLIIRATLRNEIATCEPWIVVLAAVGNYPAQCLPAAMVGAAIVLSAFVLFKSLHLPESLFPQYPAAGKIWHSHVLWHCAVFSGQMCYVSLTLQTGHPSA